MSIPSSRALVETTALTSFSQPFFNLPAHLWKIASAISSDLPFILQLLLKAIFQVFRQYLYGEPTGSEENGLNPLLDERRGESPGGMNMAPANPQFFIDDGRVIEDEDFLRRRSPILINQEDIPFEKLFGQLLRIGNGRGATDELRLRPVKTADPIQPSQDIGHMSAEDSPVGMQFVNHHKFQILEEVHPLRVVGEDACMKHVRVRDHNIPPGANGLPSILRSVSVIGERGDQFSDPLDEFLEFKHLILRKGFGREEIKCLRRRRLQLRAQHGKVITKGLPGGGWANDDDILSLMNRLDRIDLMGIELLDSLCFQSLPDDGVDELRKRAILPFPLPKNSKIGDTR